MTGLLFGFLIVIYYIVCHVQSRFHIPYKPYENTTFDIVHRGTMNVTECGKELLTCWEIIRPEKICQKDNFMESICGLMRHECSDLYGPLGEFGHSLHFFEMVCEYWQLHTRKFYINAFGPEIGSMLISNLPGNITNVTLQELQEP